MKLKVLYFAALREQLGISERGNRPAARGHDVAGLRSHLTQRGDAWKSALAEGKLIRMAVNQDMAKPSAADQGGRRSGVLSRR